MLSGSDERLDIECSGWKMLRIWCFGRCVISSTAPLLSAYSDFQLKVLTSFPGDTEPLFPNPEDVEELPPDEKLIEKYSFAPLAPGKVGTHIVVRSIVPREFFRPFTIVTYMIMPPFSYPYVLSVCSYSLILPSLVCSPTSPFFPLRVDKYLPHPPFSYLFNTATSFLSYSLVALSPLLAITQQVSNYCFT